MASRQQIKRRIQSVKNTRQTTKAMQMVSASKLRRAQEAAVGPREYARLAREILTHLRSIKYGVSRGASLYDERTVKHRVIILVTSDRTLAGAYNSNAIRRAIKEIVADETKHIKTSIICIGRQGARAAARIKGVEVLGVYQDLPDHISGADLRPILNTIVEQFTDEKVDAVDVIYTGFISTINQEVRQARILPAGFEDEAVSKDVASAEIEPSIDEVLESATLRLLDAQLYQMVLESSASEHAMRMVAMKNATDNASDLIEDYTLEFNNARQAAITQELAEISAGSEAIQ